MSISDTSPEIETMQLEIRRRMTVDQRLQIAFELSDTCHELRRAGIQRDHPDWSEPQIIFELLRLAFLPDPLPAWLNERF
jgi:Rv0078B-related antitoxin